MEFLSCISFYICVILAKASAVPVVKGCPAIVQQQYHLLQPLTTCSHYQPPNLSTACADAPTDRALIASKGLELLHHFQQACAAGTVQAGAPAPYAAAARLMAQAELWEHVAQVDTWRTEQVRNDTGCCLNAVQFDCTHLVFDCNAHSRLSII